MPLLRSPSSEPLWKDEFSVFTADERYVTCLACLERLGLDGSVPACDKGPVKPLQS